MHAFAFPFRLLQHIAIAVSRPVESRVKPPSRCMSLFIVFATVGLFVSAFTLYRGMVFADWTPEMITVLIGAASSLFAAIVAGIIAIINATTKAKIEQHRALSQMNHEKLDEIHVELVKNTAATEKSEEAVKASVDQTKVRVEELGRSMSDVAGHIGATGATGASGEKGDRGDKGDKGDKGDRGNGHQ